LTNLQCVCAVRGALFLGGQRSQFCEVLQQRRLKFKNPDFPPTLLIPTAWDNRTVDTVIVYQHNGRAYIIGIQITTLTPHAHGGSMKFVSDPLEHMK